MQASHREFPGLTAALAIAVILISPSSAHAQLTPGPPGPYVVDLRGALVGVPGDQSFFPPVEETIEVPARAFGFEAAAHVLPFSIGAARVGIGVAVMRGRGTVPEPGAIANVTGVVPQLSFNFGSRSGWSYLSVGYGSIRIRTTVTGRSMTTEDPDGSDEPSVPVSTEADSGSLGALNFGGGARWFLTDHVAIGFDLRFHRLQPRTSSGTPRATVLSTTAGISLR